MFQLLPGNIMPTTREALTRRLRSALEPEQAEAVIAAYPDSPSGTRALGTDLNFAVPTQHFAERHRAAGGSTWFYRFDAAVPLIGATHAAELPYLWDWSGPLALIIRGRLTSGSAGAGSPDEGPLDRVRPRRCTRSGLARLRARRPTQDGAPP